MAAPVATSLSFPLLLLLFLSCTLTTFLTKAINTTASTEIEALLAFKSAVHDPNAALSSWSAATPSAPCDWPGITCTTTSSNGRYVTELSLPRLSLSGRIPTQISTLHHLRRLSLHSNSLSGHIPTQISTLRLLRSLYLHHNSLSGDLPPQILALPNLQILHLANNLLSGHLPQTLPPNLRLLDLSSNHLSGSLLPNFPATLISINLSLNSFSGNIPATIGALKSLQFLSLSSNNFHGTLPSAITNCSSIISLRVDDNALEGQIPATLSQLPKLQTLSISRNNFSGTIPASIIFNASKLKTAQFGYNAFTGISSPYNNNAKMITYTGSLEVLEMQNNQIGDRFPEWLTGLTSLRVLDLSGNMISGGLPNEVGSLVNLVELRVGGNEMTGAVPAEIAKCGFLQVLDLERNGFYGDLPDFVADLGALRVLELGGNGFTGAVPARFGRMSRLEVLDLGENGLTGNVTGVIMQLGNLSVLNLSFNKFADGGVLKSVGRLIKLKELNLSGNAFSGAVPSSVGSLMQLTVLDLSKQNLSGSLPIELFGLPGLRVVNFAENRLSGNVPEGFSSLVSLQYLNLSSNYLIGVIPSTFGFLPNLVTLSLSKNLVSGGIPAELGNCSALEVLQLHSNNLMGEIPNELGRLSSLKELDLSENNLTGAIPDTISALANLTTLDLSSNSLTGRIPAGLGLIPSLTYLNLSRNGLKGEIPKPLGSRFRDPSVFSANKNLCGKPLRKECGYVTRRKRRRLIIILSVAGAGALLLTLCCCAYFISLLRWRKRLRAGVTGEKKRSPRSCGTERGSRGSRENGNGPKLVMFNTKITYAEALEATRNFDEENVLARGKYGPVFKASFPDGMVLAIRRLTDTSITEHTFKKEAEALGKVKHRNLTVLRGYYAGPPDVRLLVHDYMPNGNLSTLLQEASHQDGHVLNWPMRHLIALGIARGLAFLHSLPIIHGDVKPQIILFDADFEAHISDFGLNRLTLATPTDPSSSSTPIGSLGYISPELALTGEATKESDVYSFGIVLLEILTGKKPVMFTQDEDIVKWVKQTLQRGQVSELLEPGLLELDPETSEWEEFLLGVKVGLLCTAPDPTERPSMADIVFMLEGCRVGPDIPSSADPTSLPSPT